MIFSQTLRMAWLSIVSNKMRSLLTMLGIIIGVMSVTTMISIVQGATNQVSSQIQGLGTNLLTVNIRSQRDPHITTDELLTLQGQNGIGEITPVLSVGTMVTSGAASDTTTVDCTFPSYAPVRTVSVQEGRFLLDTDIDMRSSVAVLGVDIANSLFGTTHVLGNTVTISGRTFVVVGVLEPQGSTMFGSQDNKIIIPYTIGERLFKQKRISTFYVSTPSADKNVVNAAQAEVDAFLMRKTGDADSYSIFNQSSLLDTFGQVTTIMTALLGGSPAFPCWWVASVS